MNHFDGFVFQTKAVRDHYNQLQSKRRAEVNSERKLSGVEIELTEIQVLLDELHDDVTKEMEINAERDQEKRSKDDEEKKKAEEIRKKAMETHGVTKKRKGDEGHDDVRSPGVKRRSGTETLRFLMERPT